tara:strand:- start:179 stop:499 length:321 start_codon:yes stop_codon:yes gene_type:complete
MSSIPPVLKPVNRHLAIIPHVKKNETTSGVILPEGFEQEDDRYITATVLDISADCSSSIQTMRGHTATKTIVVDRSMIEEIVIGDKSYYTILENYVVGILRGFNEN